MTSTARRRWACELENEVDGIAVGARGPVLLHGYDRPAGGKWIDPVIPGKLGALDRHTGELLWLSPCEVGYGRGFGAGIGRDGEALVLGPSLNGHRIVRMSLTNGELLAAAEIPAFDQAQVSADLCVCMTAARIFSVDTLAMAPAWEFSRDEHRYHDVGRSADHALAVFTDSGSGLWGVERLDAATGEFDGIPIAAELGHIHRLAVTGNCFAILASGPGPNWPRELARPSETEHERFVSADEALSLSVFRVDAQAGDAPLWHRVLGPRPTDGLPEHSVSADSGKVYLVRGAYLEVLDVLTGGQLGNWTIPGLDQRIAWQVADGAGLLAEETRVSVFELPA